MGTATEVSAEKPVDAAATIPPADSPSESEGEENIINENALLRKLDARLLPAVGILYLLSFLDRSNGEPKTSRSRPEGSPDTEPYDI